MKVAEWMRNDLTTAGPETPVGDLAKLITRAKTPHVVIVDAVNRVLGVVSSRDLIAKHAKLHFPTYFSLLGFSVPIDTRRDEREIEQALATTARELMASDLITIGPEADIDEATTLMLDHDVGCVPVVDNGILVGIIDEQDIVRLLVIEEAE